jgi:anti-sigma B factor antagonist
MNITTVKKDKYTLVNVNESRLTSQTAPELKSLFVVLHSEGVRNIIIDISAVEYADSSGLSAILVGNRFCKGLNGTFVIAAVTESVMKIINISQLDRVLNITPTVKEAVDMVYMDEVERDLMNE